MGSLGIDKYHNRDMIPEGVHNIREVDSRVGLAMEVPGLYNCSSEDNKYIDRFPGPNCSSYNQYSGSTLGTSNRPGYKDSQLRVGIPIPKTLQKRSPTPDDKLMGVGSKQNMIYHLHKLMSLDRNGRFGMLHLLNFRRQDMILKR